MKHSREMVKAAIRTKGITQAELARRIGKDQTLISRYLSGQLEVSDKTARPIAEALDLDFEELHRQLQRDRLARRKEKYEAEFKDVLDEDKKGDEKQTFEVGGVTLTEFAVIPMLDSVPISAGAWSEEKGKRYALPHDAPIDAERSFAVRVSSRDMADDKVDEGDIIVVDTGAEVHDGDIVLAIVEGKPVLRRIYRTGKTTVLQASAEPVVFLSQKDDFEVVGRLALCIKFFAS